ncbi:MAG: hypothetical protein Satyrvirus18_9 [Satyrvirus sp.]|uniref:DUF7275 domain-containing protein n=1 Tax=Satyrvirus sp. TaxID=2487771 RepID=A0A3G5AE53_9VIRU|nr:MAG: hypothetical protein Satyrvirus18_9 [Satyrvirus sp.]
MLPVLIGSRALVEYGIVTSFRDIDLVVDETLAGQLSFKCDKKEKYMLWFGDTKIDLHLTKEPSNELLFKKCNFELECKKISLPMCEVLVPPLKILYAILKSHIHRIVPVTPYQSQNIDIWYEHVKYYQRIRDKIGYADLDNILYEKYLGLWRKIDDESVTVDPVDKLMVQLYQMRFGETNERIGDTNISLDKSPDEFFKDNVKRYIDHDELHKQVGLQFRSDPDPIFKKYQLDSSKVDLDLDTFIKSSHIERIEMLREEIMVLILERKWIPEIMEHVSGSDGAKDLLEVGSNFITNLCGQGDAWLRRFCLDHAHLLLDSSYYNFFTLQCLVDVLTDTISETKNEQEKQNFMKIVLEYNGENDDYVKYFMENIGSDMGKTVTIKENKKCNDGSIGYVDITKEKFNSYYFVNTTVYIFSDLAALNKHAELKELFMNCYNIGNIESSRYYIFYNLKNNVGICHNNKEYDHGTYFYTLNISYKDKKLSIKGNYIKCDEDDGKFEDCYSREYNSTYYHSSGCEFRETKYIKYLSSYGSSPKFLKDFLELFAKNFLDIINNDSEKWKNNYWNSNDSD